MTDSKPRGEVYIHSTTGCSNCDNGRITLYAYANQCISCAPELYKRQEIDWKSLAQELAEALKFAYMSLADCASRVKAPDAYMFEGPRDALAKYREAIKETEK